MRVVHVAPTAFGAPGLFGGGERYPRELARALASTSPGLEIRLVTFGDVAGGGADAAGIEQVILRPLTLLNGHPAHPVAAGLTSALADADIVHTHHLWSAPSRMAAAAAVAGPRFVTTDHGLGRDGSFADLAARVDRFLTVSQFSAEVLGAPPARTRVIYGGADTDRFRPDPDVRREGVLFVGRITPHKGLDRLVRALPAGATLTVVGTVGHDPAPPERNYPCDVRRLASGRDVRFAGALDDEELAAQYRRAAVFVLPSVERTCYGRPVAISELLGLSVLEAMASGTPVVASRLGGIPEVVVDGETGFLVEPGDVAGLRDRVGRVLGDPLLARRLGENGRELAVDRFTWTACARRCAAAYEELVGDLTEAPSPVRRSPRRRPGSPTPAR